MHCKAQPLIKMTNPNDPAFSAIIDGVAVPGLTKREYAAIQAMNGQLANSEMMSDLSMSTINSIAHTSVVIADALLAELGREK